MLGDIFGAPVAPTGLPLVTFLCTGNICRSPLAEKVLRQRLTEAGIMDVSVGSVGLRAVSGSGMDVLPAQIAARSGADPQHVARQADDELIRASTLVLTMTRQQRADLVREFPFALKRTFTLSEFVRIVEETPILGLDGTNRRQLFDTVVEAGHQRSSVALTDGDDIEDPYRRSVETHERVGARIVELVDRLAVGLLLGHRGRTPNQVL
jgi:protein-tyrosine phosphatase